MGGISPAWQCIQSPEKLVLHPFALKHPEPRKLVFILFALEAFFPPPQHLASQFFHALLFPDSEPFFKALRLKSAEASVSQCSAILLPWQKELTKSH